METNTLTPVKQTLGILANDILEKAYRIKTRESDLRQKIFGLGESEGKISDSPETIEQKLFVIRNVLDIIIARLDEDINNLD